MIHDVVVVGAGIWGASAVEAYDRAGCSVAWISDDDPEHPTAASADIVRIVRAEYADPAYRQFAQTCLDAFQTEDPYRRYFHRSGWFLLQDEEQARRGSIPRGTERVSADEFQHVFPNAHVENNLLITRADNVGWVEANNLQRALLAQSRVKPRRGTVTSLILEGAFCRGVRLGAKEEEVLGRTVILATGWRANELLATHNLLLVDCQIVGVPVLGVQLSEEQYSKYRKMPIICQPGKGEILPPTPERIMRVNTPHSFALKSTAAAPSLLDPTHPCLKDSRRLLETYFPSLEGCPTVISRMCWDAFTDSQSFRIQQIGGANNVYYVGGGSFHSWKFRPALPNLIAARLGIAEERIDENIWASLMQAQSSKHADLVPTRHWE